MSIENLKTFGKNTCRYMDDFRDQLNVIAFHHQHQSTSPCVKGVLLTLPLTRHSTDPFAEAEEHTGENKQSQNYIHIRIQRISTSRHPPGLRG